MIGRLPPNWIILVVLLSALAPIGADAASVRYLAWNERTRSGTIATSAGARQVELGDSVPGLGTIVELDATHVVLRKVLSDAERASIEARGFAAYRARDLEVIREDLAIRMIPIR